MCDAGRATAVAEQRRQRLLRWTAVIVAGLLGRWMEAERKEERKTRRLMVKVVAVACRRCCCLTAQGTAATTAAAVVGVKGSEGREESEGRKLF